MSTETQAGLQAVVSEGDFPIGFYNDPALQPRAVDSLRTICTEVAAGRGMVLSDKVGCSWSVVYKRLVDGPGGAPAAERCAASAADHVTLRMQCWAALSDYRTKHDPDIKGEQS